MLIPLSTESASVDTLDSTFILEGVCSECKNGHYSIIRQFIAVSQMTSTWFDKYTIWYPDMVTNPPSICISIWW